MSQSRERTNQKARTRDAIVEAGRTLVRDGKLPTVVDTARAARVSQATAYRYFPDQFSLLTEALQGIGPIPGFKPEADPAGDPGERLERAATRMLKQVLEREALIRTVMGLSLLRSADGTLTREQAVSMRPGHRKAVIEEALKPLEGGLPAADFKRLKDALSVLVSSEALVALQDVTGLSREEAVKTCVWAARTLVDAVPKKAVRKAS
jgi:AcrR family transcriptional regulator